MHLILSNFGVNFFMAFDSDENRVAKLIIFASYGGRASDGVADPRAGRGPDVQDMRGTVVHSHVFPFNPLQEVRAAREE